MGMAHICRYECTIMEKPKKDTLDINLFYKEALYVFVIFLQVNVNLRYLSICPRTFYSKYFVHFCSWL